MQTIVNVSAIVFSVLIVIGTLHTFKNIGYPRPPISEDMAYVIAAVNGWLVYVLIYSVIF